MYIIIDIEVINVKKKIGKYHNRKVEIDGFKFDSQKEGNRYLILKRMEKEGKIKDLQRQVSFEIVPKSKGERAVRYVADFMYVETVTGNIIVEDVKGYRTEVYNLKRKLFKYRYPEYTFIET